MVTINIKKGHLICFGVFFFLFGILTFINSAVPNGPYHLLSEMGFIDSTGNFISVDGDGDGVVDKVNGVSWDQITGKPEGINDGIKYCKCNKLGSTLTGICGTGCAAGGDITKTEYYMDIGDDGNHASIHGIPNPSCPVGTKRTIVFERLSNQWDGTHFGGSAYTGINCMNDDNGVQRLAHLKDAIREQGFLYADVIIMANDKLSNPDYHDGVGCNAVRVAKCETITPDYYYNIPL